MNISLFYCLKFIAWNSSCFNWLTNEQKQRIKTVNENAARMCSFVIGNCKGHWTWLIAICLNGIIALWKSLCGAWIWAILTFIKYGGVFLLLLWAWVDIANVESCWFHKKCQNIYTPALMHTFDPAWDYAKYFWGILLIWIIRNKKKRKIETLRMKLLI